MIMIPGDFLFCSTQIRDLPNCQLKSFLLKQMGGAGTETHTKTLSTQRVQIGSLYLVPFLEIKRPFRRGAGKTLRVRGDGRHQENSPCQIK